MKVETLEKKKKKKRNMCNGKDIERAGLMFITLKRWTNTPFWRIIIEDAQN